MTTARNGSPAGRVAIVTGGSRGVGRAAARRLAAGGYAVAVSYLRGQRAAESAVDAILAGGGDAVAIRADTADDLDVQRLFAETIAAFGGIDAVIHAAASRTTAAGVTGAGLDESGALMRISTRATFVVNQRGSPSPPRRRRDRQPVQHGGRFLPEDPRPLPGSHGPR